MHTIDVDNTKASANRERVLREREARERKKKGTSRKSNERQKRCDEDRREWNFNKNQIDPYLSCLEQACEVHQIWCGELPTRRHFLMQHDQTSVPKSARYP